MNQTADRILYALELIDRPGTTLAVTIRWHDGAAEQAVTLRLTENDPRIPIKVQKNARNMLYEALHRRRTEMLFRLIKEGRP